MNTITKKAFPVRLTTGLLLCLLVTACTTKIAYNHMDWILEWYVDDLVTLNEDQDWALADAIEQELLWHRHSQLPLYVDALDRLTNSIHRGLTYDDLRHFFRTTEKSWTILKQHSTPAVTRLLRSLNDAQVDELLKNLEKQNQELEEDYVDKPDEKRVEQRVERMADRIESWTGDLNSEQRQVIKKWSRQIKPLSKQWIATRRTWQANLGQILRNYRDKPRFDHLIHDLVYNSRKFWPQWYYDAYYHNIHLTLEMLTGVIQQLTPAQTEHLLGELKRLRRNFEELSKNT